MSHSTIFIWAFLAGIIPPLLWLLFWLREDKLHPEPKLLIMLSFISGMIAVPLVIPLEKYVAAHVLGGRTIDDTLAHSFWIGFLGILLWAFIEELCKLLAAYFSVLTRKQVDEPQDAIIYLISAALGFASMENVFFLLQPMLKGQALATIITGDLRFIGATLLHISASATIGVFIALSFYRRKMVKRTYLIIGVILSVLLHTTFNLFIIRSKGESIFISFIFVWLAIISLLLIFEKVKRVHPVA